MLSKVYGESSTARSKVYKWHRCFKVGRESIEENERVGRPSTSRNAENVPLVFECVQKDGHKDLYKSLRLHTSGRRRLRQSIRRKRPQFWQSDD
ncbi:hypothetical protein TNCV_4581661 [Trichonephila clavipes]|nr:hypothetical protein TNCV_4581661 [Trichonephila clavipes]